MYHPPFGGSLPKPIKDQEGPYFADVSTDANIRAWKFQNHLVETSVY